MNTKLIQPVSDSAGSVACAVSFSHHPQYIALRMSASAPQIYDFAAERFLPDPAIATATSIAFRPHRFGHGPSHEAAAVDAKEKRAVRFDVRTGELLSACGGQEAVRCLTYSHGGDCLATGSLDGKVRVFQLDKAEGGVYLEAKVTDDTIVDLAFGPGALYGITANGATFTWDMLGSNAQDKFCLRSPAGERFDWDCYALAADSDLKFVAFGGEGHQVFILAPRTAHIETLDTSLGAFVRSVHFDRSGWQLTLAGKHAVEVWTMGPFERVDTQTFVESNLLGAKTYGDLLVVVGRECPTASH